jgi:hypothetical protein
MSAQFKGKKDSTFTFQESKDILNYLLEEFMDDDMKKTTMSFDEMINGTANGLGLSSQQVRDAFSLPSVKKIVDELELSQNQLVQGNHNLINHLNKPFAFKVGLEFTPQESMDIWVYTKNEYLCKKEYKVRKFEEAIKGVANDLGLTTMQVRAALSHKTRSAFRKLESTHNKRVKLHYEAIRFINTANYPRIIRILKLYSVWSWFLKLQKTK